MGLVATPGSRRGRLSVQFSTLVFAQGVAAAVLVVLNVLLAKGLGPEGFGIYALFVAISAVGALPLSWLSAAILVFGQEDAVRRGNARSSTGAIAAYALLSLSAAVAIAVVGDATIVRLFPALSGFTALIAGYALASALGAVALGVLQAAHALGRYGVLVVLSAVLPLCFAVVASVTVGIDPQRAAACLVAGQLLAPLPFLASLGRRMERPELEPTSLRVLGRFIVAYLAGSVQGYLVGNADVILVGLVFSPAALGIYGLATRVYKQLLVFAQVFGTVALPRINLQRIEGAHADVVDYVDRRTPQILMIVAIASSIAAGATAAVVPLLFGDRFAAAVVPLMILMVGFLFATWRRLVSPVLTSYQLIWHANLAALVSAAVLVGATIVLAPPLGPVGAAIAVVLAAISDALVALRFVHRRLGGRLTVDAAAAIGAGALVIAAPVLHPAHAPVALALALVGSIALVAVVRAVGLFGPGDVALVDDLPGPKSLRRFAALGARALIGHHG